MFAELRLIAGLRRGDPAVLAPIYDAYAVGLHTLAWRLLGDAAAAEDAVHDVFVRLAASGGVEVRGGLRGYLAAAVANRARDTLRAPARRDRVPLAVGAIGVAAVVDDPSAVVRRDEQRDAVAGALVELPWEQREVVLLRVLEGWRFRRIAAHQRVALNTVKGRYRYGVEKLRALLADELSP